MPPSRSRFCINLSISITISRNEDELVSRKHSQKNKRLKSSEYFLKVGKMSLLKGGKALTGQDQLTTLPIQIETRQTT